jgi:ABC-type bacteriocin/lantibiotic exporter with double-glycine peptidase domain
LPACAQMALAQLGVEVPQQQVAQILGTRAGLGTPFSRVTLINQLDIQVDLLQQASVNDLIENLNADSAVILSITTNSGLPGWGNIRTQHSVLIVGIDDEQIVYHDPALARGPVSALLTEFLLAWGEMDEQVALLRRR